jgi:diadenosine tetraphosphate (Ap4A) HIT family hydrolase
MVYSANPNPTMLKFGYPDSLVHHYDSWSWLVRPRQATLGALGLVCRDAVEAFSEISEDAFRELAVVTGDIEAALSEFRPYAKINYLMLMMVDRDVHFHVLPRYDKEQSFAGTDFSDSGWPGVPDLSAGPLLEGAALRDLAAELGRLRQDRAD